MTYKKKVLTEGTNNYLPSHVLESQEHLSADLLNKLVTSNVININKLSERPISNFIDLMNWVNNNFSVALQDRVNLNKFVHNRIIIDGQFLQFCKEKEISIEVLYKDSLISWKTESNYEKFFVQGVFLIKSKNCEFIHSALFHKGNQNEDEISFSVIVSQKNYETYLKIRNEFDNWVQDRDRSNLHIRVVDSEDIPYNKDTTWDDLVLPENIKLELKNLVEVFLSSKDFYLKNKMPWKRGVLLYGKPGCHAKGTPIMMSDGSWKNAENIKVGEYLMGPDSKPREVLKLVRGKENMYKIVPVKGKSFIVNENHILHLRHSGNSKELPPVCNITVKDYLNLSKSLRDKLKLVKSLNLEFHYSNDFQINSTYKIDSSKIFKKQPNRKNSNKNLKMVDIKSVESVGIDNFYGFTVDKDHLYIMDDFWITHNCGKTSIIRTIMSMYNFKPVTIVPGANDEAIREAFSYAEEQSPSLLYFEDLDSILEKNDISSFLNLMDGISTKNGLLVVATANEVKKLKANITDRPSRFDRKFEIPLPNQEMSYIYIKKWFGTSISTKKCRELSKYSEKYQFSYAYLKDLYISSMFEALSHNRKTPTDKDIDNALKRLVKEKNVLNNKSISTDKYFK